MFAKPVKEGEVGSIKLIDFGLCCPFRPGAKITRAAGTPYSVAPELVTPPVQYDQRHCADKHFHFTFILFISFLHSHV